MMLKILEFKAIYPWSFNLLKAIQSMKRELSLFLLPTNSYLSRTVFGWLQYTDLGESQMVMPSKDYFISIYVFEQLNA
jgi:hypothetical protein